MPVQTRPLRILIVEDNAINARLAVAILKVQGHDTTVRSNGQEALDALQREPFDVVLMDEQMPVMSGLEAVARIRKSEELTGRHVPIVALTANATEEDRERCLAAGVDGYVAKPIQEEELFTAIANLCTGSAPTMRVESRPDTEDAFRRELAGMFLADCPKSMSTIRAAVAGRDGPGLRLAAHTLKGSAGAFKDSAAVAAALRMEKVGQDEDWENAGSAGLALAGEMERLSASLLDTCRESTNGRNGKGK